MKEQEFREILAERDQVIESLILSSLMNVGKHIDLNEQGAINAALKQVYDPNAIEHLVDSRATFEMNEFLKKIKPEKLTSLLKHDEKRRAELTASLKKKASELRILILTK